MAEKTQEQPSGLRRSGISVVGDMTWGTHFCHFYETKQDLLDTLVPYFKAGLEDNEFCVWVVSEPLEEETAWTALGAAVPEFQRYLSAGSMEIIHARDWYLAGGTFDQARLSAAWDAKLQQALARGYAGMRISGNTSWLERKSWRHFCEYERAINETTVDRPMSVLCTYPLQTSSAGDILDVTRTHQFALASRQGKWEFVETPQLKAAREKIKKLRAELKERVLEVRAQDSRRLRALRTVSDEIGNHLNAINLVVACLMIRAPNSNASREDLEGLGSSVKNLRLLMNQLLDCATSLSGSEKLELERIAAG